MIDALMTEAEVAAVLRLSPKTLRNWRVQRLGPPFTKIGRRIGYRPRDVERFLDDQAKLTAR